MAGPLFHKFLKTPSALRIITSFNKPPTIVPNNLTNPLLVSSNTTDKKTNSSSSQPPLHFYPSFPFGYFLNPNQSEEVVEENAQKVWADSVKKKRKSKMNKHKFKKLRKRLRLKT